MSYAISKREGLDVEYYGYETEWKELRKKNEIRIALINIFIGAGMDTPNNFETIVTYCYEDACNSTDENSWHSGDVSIAFRRYIEDSSNANDKDYEKDNEEDLGLGKAWEKIVNSCPEYTPEQLRTIATGMIKWGGSFVKNLGEALRSADTTNSVRLAVAFPEYMEIYLNFYSPEKLDLKAWFK